MPLPNSKVISQSIVKEKDYIVLICDECGFAHCTIIRRDDKREPILCNMNKSPKWKEK